MSSDPHAEGVEALRRDVLDGPGTTDRDARERALRGEGSGALGPFLRKVRDESYRITDGDIAALHAAGYDDDAIFELTVAAAVGASYERLDAARRLIGTDR
ncbi:MAG TPA: hypothetical protein VFM93_08265 [Candidatus Limnocylindria bacterium]|nr:hypothetical protein [Candidatus Limnocylindria bacterium]